MLKQIFIFICLIIFQALKPIDKPVFKKNSPFIVMETQQVAHNSPITIFAPGLGSNMNRATHYHVTTNKDLPYPSIEGELVTFNFNDAYSTNPLWYSSIGQEMDIEQLKHVIDICKNKEIDLFGVSRGAATIANFTGLFHNDNIKSVILESPFDDMQQVLDWKTPLLRFLSHHDPSGIQPIKSADSTNKELPILIVCSKEDTVIPASSSIAYYKALRKINHDKVHILIVNKGEHAHISFGKDGELTRNVIHAFKRKYARPHNPEWANAGEAYFNQCQP